MKALGLIRDVAIALAAISVILFWVFGGKGFPDVAAWSLIIGGICAWIALIAMIIKRILERRNYII